MLKKIISGGQSGADLAGLDVAKAMQMETGGTMPFGFKALDADGKTVNHPDYAEKYGIVASDSSSYAVRTKKNVADSDGTIILGYNLQSKGTMCTLKSIILLQKPHLMIDLNDPPSRDDVVDWLKSNNIETLNVAGNSEKTYKGTYDSALLFLTNVLISY